jgi:SAM-dependent MidA family methyltransferase
MATRTKVFPEQDHGELPQPEAAALAHSERLRDRILAAIDSAGGTLPFSHYMQMALYEPGLGYYSAGATKFGATGDFVTAVDQGDFLARSIVTTLAPRLDAMADPVILECGGGTGQLAADILRLLAARGLERVAYRMLEPSPDLRARQAERLASLIAEGRRISWIDRLEPASISGAIIANEVADALPFDRVLRTATGWNQLAVKHAGREFRWSEVPLSQSQSEQIDAVCAGLDEVPAPGYTSEIRPLLAGWVDALTAALAAGEILLIDYGMSRREYYHPQRTSGTLMCHYRHRAHADPFVYPGLQDITAWVDFSACAQAAQAQGVTVAGYATQGGWIAAALAADASLRDALDIAQAAQLRTLLLPGEMGERFKALLLSRPPIGDAPLALPGRDLRSRL